ncbi:MAG: undecaprenyl-diphosphate phosphatase [Thermoplasmata archaeon]
MNIWQAVLLGIIQGITEWFPVSSSGHLVLTKHFLGIEPSLFFDVFVHFGSALVVLIIFRKEVKNVIASFFSALKDLPVEGGNAFFKTADRKLSLFIILASIPTGLIGLLVSYYYEGFLSDPFWVGAALLLTGIVLISTKGRRGHKSEKEMTSLDGILVGIMQGIAAVPGISRSGFTISTAIHRRLDRDLAVRYSFLLFLPAITAAGLLKASSLTSSSTENLIPIFIGTVTAVIVGYVSIKTLLKLIEKGKFYMFSFYCLAVGTVLVYLSA